MSNDIIKIDREPKENSFTSCVVPSYSVSAGELPEMNTEAINSILDDKTSMNTDILLAGADTLPSEILFGLDARVLQKTVICQRERLTIFKQTTFQHP